MAISYLELYTSQACSSSFITVMHAFFSYALPDPHTPVSLSWVSPPPFPISSLATTVALTPNLSSNSQGPPLLAASSLNVASTSSTSIKPWHSPEDNSFSAHFSHKLHRLGKAQKIYSFPLLLLHHFFPSHTKVSLLEFMASSYFNFSILCGPDVILVPDFQSLVPGSISLLPHVPSSSWMTSMFLRKICHNCLQLLPQLLLPQLHIRLFHNTGVCDLKLPYSFLRTSVFASFLLLAQDHECLPQPASIWWPLPPPDFILHP